MTVSQTGSLALLCSLSFALLGCASADSDAEAGPDAALPFDVSGDGGGLPTLPTDPSDPTDPVDPADPGGFADAGTPTPPGPGMAIVLSQTTSTEIGEPNYIACLRANPQVHAQSSYYRVFNLAQYGVGSSVTINSVRLGVRAAIAGGQSQTVQVRLHTLAGALDEANLTLLASATATVTNQEYSLLDVPMPAPVQVPGTANLVIEVYVPDGTGQGNVFVPGGNGAGETAPTYYRSPTCRYNQIVSIPAIAAAGDPPRHLVIEAHGTAAP